MDPLPVSLKESDRVEVLTLMDNFVDVLLEDTKVVSRPPKAIGTEIPTDTLLAEHGLSLLVKVQHGAEKHTILFDTGYNSMGVLHNMAKLAVDPNEMEAIVLSHAHMDHTGSLHPILQKISTPIPLVVHPDAFLYPRFVEEKDGSRKRFPRTLVRTDLDRRNVELLESKTPTPILDETILVTGEVERTTEFEKGMPNALIERDGNLEPDPIKDDQALVMHLKNKGLVVVPMHCTGRKAMEQFSREFPSSFVLNSVGSKITLN